MGRVALVDRNFTADKPNMLWVVDITYISTQAGFLYLAVVLDAFSRRIVGLVDGDHLAYALFTILYRSTDRLRRSGAPVSVRRQHS